MNPNRELKQVGDLIDVVLSQIAHADVGPVMRLRQRWVEVAGRWAQVCSPVRLKDGVLTVETVSGGAASKLRYGSVEIIEGARAIFEDDTMVTSVVVRVGRSTPVQPAGPD